MRLTTLGQDLRGGGETTAQTAVEQAECEHRRGCATENLGDLVVLAFEQPLAFRLASDLVVSVAHLDRIELVQKSAPLTFLLGRQLRWRQAPHEHHPSDADGEQNQRAPQLEPPAGAPVDGTQPEQQLPASLPPVSTEEPVPSAQ